MSEAPDREAEDVSGDRDLFRQAFRRHAATVVVLTYLDSDGAACGMTATSMCSLSADPPSLLACVNREARAHAEIAARGRFGVNLLTVDQRPIADHCSRTGAPKRLRENWIVAEDEWVALDMSADSTPRLRDGLAHLECRVDTSYVAYSHTVFLGLIQSVWLNPRDAPPLLYHGGIYSQLESPTERAERFHWELRED
jgi:flavin reductase (DIM6/NTAB) family NADH-FMN oxidoreductase RutF